MENPQRGAWTEVLKVADPDAQTSERNYGTVELRIGEQAERCYSSPLGKDARSGQDLFLLGSDYAVRRAFSKGSYEAGEPEGDPQSRSTH